ncbi:LytR/AlgR family response regulator transcription factor [Aquimarina algiphila]|uniref:Response regulator transcription factor n=1 Tax=Aquimarina algiphila TaxID=2047982 RepID=A0A554VCS4_9FLAO|nr:LytTR family DNA-binding domain-containing protein [Aquimarina algiphila]TSE04569.1 response regulator transcription factor [Aquimarina algiphila]
MLKCLVIDDEELARTLLKTYIDRLNFLEMVSAVENPLEALQILKTTDIDVVFLDIQMPDLKGTDFAKMIPETTQIIFTTAYSEYALEGFELNALDYLLKPITFERFLIAVNKIKRDSGDTISQNTMTIKSGYDLYKLKYNDILYIESDSEYVIFYTAEKKIMSHLALKSLEATLPKSIFMRVHRSYIVNKNKVTSLKGKEILISEIKIPVSSSYYDLVKDQIF